MQIKKRDFLAASWGVGIGAVLSPNVMAQPVPNPPAPSRRPPVPRRKASTKVLFKAPPGLPNAIAVTSEGLWIGEQKMSGGLAQQYNMREPGDLREAPWL